MLSLFEGYQDKICSKDYIIKFDTLCKESSKEVISYVVGKNLGYICIEYNMHSKKSCRCKITSYKQMPVGDLIDCNFDKINLNTLAQRISSSVIKTGRLISYNLLVKDLEEYLELDYLCMNSDRHLGNIVLYEESDKILRLLPIFDMGLALLGREEIYDWNIKDKIKSDFILEPYGLFASELNIKDKISRKVKSKYNIIESELLNNRLLDKTLVKFALERLKSFV